MDGLVWRNNGVTRGQSASSIAAVTFESRMFTVGEIFRNFSRPSSQTSHPLLHEHLDNKSLVIFVLFYPQHGVSSWKLNVIKSDPPHPTANISASLFRKSIRLDEVCACIPSKKNVLMRFLKRLTRLPGPGSAFHLIRVLRNKRPMSLRDVAILLEKFGIKSLPLLSDWSHAHTHVTSTVFVSKSPPTQGQSCPGHQQLPLHVKHPHVWSNPGVRQIIWKVSFLMDIYTRATLIRPWPLNCHLYVAVPQTNRWYP